MPITVNRSDGTFLTVINDNSFDSTTSLNLPGIGLIEYGKELAENWLHTLEHFANSTPPANPISGQLWYDTSIGILKLYNGIAYESILSSQSGVDSPILLSATGTVPGQLFWDTTNQDLYAWNGSSWNLIGPTPLPSNEDIQDITGPMFDHGAHLGIIGEYQDGSDRVRLVIENEYIQDIVGGMVSGNVESNITVSYNDATGKIDFTVPVAVQRTDEEIRDVSAAQFNHANHFGIAAVVQDTADRVDLSIVQETIQDIVGAMIDGNVETGINVTYNDSAGKLNFQTTAPTSLGGDVTGPLTNTQIAPNTIGQAELEINAVTTNSIVNGAVTHVKLATDAVETDNIANFAVTEPLIGTGAVTNTKIANSAVSTNKIADSAVNTQKILNDAVTTDKIANAGSNQFLRTNGAGAPFWENVSTLVADSPSVLLASGVAANNQALSSNITIYTSFAGGLSYRGYLFSCFAPVLTVTGNLPRGFAFENIEIEKAQHDTAGGGVATGGGWQPTVLHEVRVTLRLQNIRNVQRVTDGIQWRLYGIRDMGFGF